MSGVHTSMCSTTYSLSSRGIMAATIQPVELPAGHNRRKRRLSYGEAEVVPAKTAFYGTDNRAMSPASSKFSDETIEQRLQSHPSCSYPDSPTSVLSFDSELEDKLADVKKNLLASGGESDTDTDDLEDAVDSDVGIEFDSHSSEESSVITPLPPPHIGTIYEARLAPLSPAVTLTTSSDCPVSVSSRGRLADPVLQKKFTAMVSSAACSTAVSSPPLLDELDRFLVEHSGSVDVNEFGMDGCTALHRVCERGGSVALARVLVRHGADVSLTSRDGWSCLHMASFSGNSQLMLYIIACPR